MPDGRRRGLLRRLFQTAALLALLAALALLLRPWLRQAVRMVRLMREPIPASLPVPVEGVEREALADTWGAARSEGRRHEGIDIFAPRGAQVLSATHGVVLYRGWNRLGGKTVTVLGPGGYRHYYAHLDEYDAPDNGDWVEQGEVLGYVGDTGNAAGTPPHLHYGVYAPGSGAVNPFPLLRGPRRRPPTRPPKAAARRSRSSDATSRRAPGARP